MFAFSLRSFFLLTILCLSFALLGLQGCAGNLGMVKDTLGLVSNRGVQDHTLAQTLNPALRYLRVTVGGTSVLLVLGYVEPDATEVWYSGQGEVVKLKNGRIVATTGTPVEWLAVRHQDVPHWPVQASVGEQKNYQRHRDVKANYQFGIMERVTLEVIAKPTEHAPQGLLGGSQNLVLPNVVWLVERYQPSVIPPSYFAVSTDSNQTSSVVYSWQCLSSTFCLKLQPWSLGDHAAHLERAKLNSKAGAL